MPHMTSQLGKIIKARLTEIDATQEWLAEQVGVSKMAVSKWIRTGNISRESAIGAARALGLTFEQLLGQTLVDVSPSTGTTLERLDAQEKQLIEFFRRATKDGKLMIFGAATVAPKEQESSAGRRH
jgi:transcriptional regulator with XRE-family HTH domain